MLLIKRIINFGINIGIKIKGDNYMNQITLETIETADIWVELSNQKIWKDYQK